VLCWKLTTRRHEWLQGIARRRAVAGYPRSKDHVRAAHLTRWRHMTARHAPLGRDVSGVGDARKPGLPAAELNIAAAMYSTRTAAQRGRLGRTTRAVDIGPHFYSGPQAASTRGDYLNWNTLGRDARLWRPGGQRRQVGAPCDRGWPTAWWDGAEGKGSDTRPCS